MCTPISISSDGVVEDTESFIVSVISEDPAVELTQPLSSVIINDSTSKFLLSICYVVHAHWMIIIKHFV